MSTITGILVGETDPASATRLVETYQRCPYCVMLTTTGEGVIGLYTLPADHRWWLEWVEARPQETLGLQRAEVLFAERLSVSSPWSRGEVQAAQDQAPCGARCPECAVYLQQCKGCPATPYYEGNLFRGSG